MKERHRRTPDRIEAAIEFGLQMRNARISQGKSGRGVAKLAGISPAYLFALEQGKNPNTMEPSIPSPDIKNRISSVLGIIADIENDASADSPSGTSKVLNYSTLNIRKLGIMSAHEREKAANMVRDGLIDVDSPNNEFNFYIALANSYGSAAVAMQAVISQLDKDIKELKDKYKIGEKDVNSQGLQQNIADTQEDTLMSKVQSENTSFESELGGSSLRVEDPRV